MSDYDELKQLAEAATPGPWVKSAPGEVSSADYEVDGQAMCDHIASGFGCGGSDPDDAAFVAAANPDAVLALIADRDALAAQRDEGLAREAELQSQLAKQGDDYCKRVDELITLQQRLAEAHTALQDIQRICNAMGYLSEIHKVADKALAIPSCTNENKPE